MALSIVPVLLSLLASLPPGRIAGNDLVVHVVDKEGKPVAGMQVGLCPNWPGHASTAGIGLSDVAGNARIDGALDTVRRDTSHSYFVRLGMPADPDVRVELDREHLDEASPTLVVPDHGRVVLKLPAVAEDGSRARLRCAPRTPKEEAAIWSGSSLPQVSCKDHLATCEFAGLGLDLEYEVLGTSLPRPLGRKFRGPSKSGELVTIVVQGFESSPTFRARLVDEDSRPVARVRLQWSLGTHSETVGSGSFSWKGGTITTDEQGRVAIPISDTQALQPNRTLILTGALKGTAESIGEASVKLTIPDEFHENELDLGEQVLAHFGSPKRFQALDDKALEARFLALVDSGMSATPDDGDGHVEVLCEMIRRGGAELEHFVANCADNASDESGHPPWGMADALVLRTALARMRHQPDPLSIYVDLDSWLDPTFPEAPRVECVLANTSAEGHSFTTMTDRNWNCRIEAMDSNGHVVRQRSSEPFEGWCSFGEFHAGQCRPLRVDLGSVLFPGSGEYRVRVYYSPYEDLDRLTSMRGRIVISSREFTVRIRPCTVTLSKARMDELRGAVRALDLEKLPPLVLKQWQEVMEFEGEAHDPEEVLFRAGREALPALVEALEDPKLEPERRAWVFAMLWNIAGMYDPTEQEGRSPIGRSLKRDAWPSSVEGKGYHDPGHEHDGDIDTARQAEFTKLWLETKANYELKIVP